MPASDFLDIHNPQISLDTTGGKIMAHCGLTARNVSMLLSAPDVFPPPLAFGTTNNGIMVDSGTTNTTSWMDVAIETCWLVSYLTNGDSMAVDFLCDDKGQDTKKSSVVISMLVSRLVHATDAASRQLNIAASNNAGVQEDVMGCLIPCCRALKNMAIACDGRYVNSILLATMHIGNNPTTATATAIRPAEASLAMLISLGTLGAGSEVTTIASEAASLAGACLYDAGLPLPHPATSVCRTLLPALCQALVSPLCTFEFRREVAWAVWTAVDFPSKLRNPMGAMAGEMMQNELLLEIIRTPPEGAMAGALTTMLSSLDSDVLEASVSLINLLLRRLENNDVMSSDVGFGGKKRISILFEEAGLVDALWRICDHDVDESETAELAAEILDDFYEQDEDDEGDASMLQPALAGGQFQFQPPSSQGFPEGGFNFGQ